MSKNIALFIDGTWNRPKLGAKTRSNTNVRLMYKTAVRDGVQQMCRYLAGVGSGRWDSARGGLGGFGTARRIMSAYRYLAANYDRGDRVYVFGFSRGAFAARSLVGFIDAVGILLRDHIHLVPKAYRYYASGRDPRRALPLECTQRIEPLPNGNSESPNSLPVYFVGVWDTVASLGVPFDPWLSPRANRFHIVELPRSVTHARHALALHERRVNFQEVLWKGRHPDAPWQTLVQTWFAGSHADVGGGYATDAGGRRSADVALAWMQEEAMSHQFLSSHTPAGSAARREFADLHDSAHEKCWRLLPRADRYSLACHSRLSGETRRTIRVHSSLLERMCHGGIDRYKRVSRSASRRWNKMDELAVRAHLHGCYGEEPLPPEAREYVRSVSAAEILNANKLVVAPFAIPSGEQLRSVSRSFYYAVLCGSPGVAMQWCESVLEVARALTNELKSATREVLNSGLEEKGFRCAETLQGISEAARVLPSNGEADRADLKRRSGEVRAALGMALTVADAVAGVRMPIPSIDPPVFMPRKSVRL